MKAAAIGSIVGVAFGAGWGIVGATGLPRPWREWALGLSVGISVALILALAMSQAVQKSQTFRGSIYGAAVAFEVIAIFAAVLLLPRFALSQFLVPTIGIIVGLHFIGLWKATDLFVFRWTAVAMCVVCTFSLLLPGLTGGGTNARQAVAGLGSAVVLWGAGAATLF